MTYFKAIALTMLMVAAAMLIWVLWYSTTQILGCMP